MARRYYRRTAANKAEDEGCAFLLGAAVGICVWYLIGSWIASLTFPYAVGFCAFLLGSTAPVIPILVGLLVWAFFRKPTAKWRKPVGIGLLVCLGIFGVGVAIDAWQAEQARTPKQWSTWGSESGIQLNLHSSWDAGQIRYRLRVNCPGAYCLSEDNVLVDLLNGVNREATFVVWAGRANTELTAPVGRAAYIAASSWKPFIYPTGKRAVCGDGWLSESTGQGTCSHHSGVSRWLP